MTVTWFGDRAVRVTLADPATRYEVVAAMRAALPGCGVRAGMDSVLVEAPIPDPGLLDAVVAVTDEPTRGPAARATARTVVVQVHYDGIDLDETATMLSLTPAGLIAAHQAQQWQVAMMGFAPGFGYLEPLGRMLVDWSVVQRRATPRVQVPAGSVAVAAGMSAVYPHALPGGWQLIGTTETVLFDAEAAGQPSVLHPGDVVRFAELG